MELKPASGSKRKELLRDDESRLLYALPASRNAWPQLVAYEGRDGGKR